MRLPPLRVRLTAWYLVVILASLTLYSVAIYYGLRQALEETADHQLSVRSDNLEQFLKDRSKEQAAPSSGQAASPSDDLYRVINSANAVVYESAAMKDLGIPLTQDQHINHFRHHRDNGDFTTFYRRATDVRVRTEKIQAGTEEYRVQVALFMSPLYDVLDTFSGWAFMGLPLIVCCAGLSGYWLSGRVLKPLRDLVIATRHISERNLSNRLKVPSPKDELQELTLTMNSMLGRLESAFSRITRFTSDASHELRTPITVIRTTSEVILERDRSAEEYKEMVGQILSEAEFTSVLIEQLLTLARADADIVQLNLEPCELASLVTEIDARTRKVAESLGVSWAVELSHDSIFVLGDRAYLRRLLQILVENACRYTPPGGSIRLQLARTSDQAVIEVIDTGIGIPANELAKIFDRFYRGSNARSFASEGTGLGLSIAQWIAAAHRGTLTAQSTVGVGTSMKLNMNISE